MKSKRSSSRRRAKRFITTIMSKPWVWAGILFLCAGIWFSFFSLPDPLFDCPTSTIVEDRRGRLLAARIAQDGQWRFPPSPQVPEKVKHALIHFEDRRFAQHCGVDLRAVFRAIAQNVKAGEIQSGASTLTMQVIRLSRPGKPRTLRQKMIEAILAVRLELSFDKQDILATFLSHAPFGGNVVGLDAAAWRYFGRSPNHLSWAEAATLAVLPNAPGLIHPGRNRRALKAKRDRLLDTLKQRHVIDPLTWRAAKAEPLPRKPHPLPRFASHLLDRVCRHSKTGQRLHTTLDATVQRRAIKILESAHCRLTENGVHNGAVLVIENKTGHVIAYVGNCGDFTDPNHESAVDIIPARRSTGSLLKPFLYAGALDAGQILPHTILPDIPTNFGGYSPENFTRTFQGMIPADEALAHSLNVPAVRLLRRYGVAPFKNLLQRLGMTTLDRPASHYGLSLILGGSEGSLWELTGMYAGMARTLIEAQRYPFRSQSAFFEPTIVPREQMDDSVRRSPLSPGSVWHTLEALTQLNRPRSQQLWHFFSSTRRIAWKTGTSYGFRDAWAIGTTPSHTVGVWIGNADGEGRPGLTGVTAAAPVMFEVFRSLNLKKQWFSPPMMDLRQVEICAQSGHRASHLCPKTKTMHVPRPSLRSTMCPYHQVVFTDPTGRWQVTDRCLSPKLMQRKTVFVLPPLMAQYYASTHPDYRRVPPHHPDCRGLSLDVDHRPLELVYPPAGTKILVPKELDGSSGRTIFEAAHDQPHQTIHWHLNDHYLGATRDNHKMPVNPPPGTYRLVLVDEDGHRLQRNLQILGE